MRNLPDINLTENFTRYEFIEATMPSKAVRMNWESINEYNQSNSLRILAAMQVIRGVINKHFLDKNAGRTITLIISSGFRCKAWEKFKKRSGRSRHTHSDAVDVYPGNCSLELAVEIIGWVYERYNPRSTGWIGGFARGLPTYKDGELKAPGFLHFDLGTTRRWTY